ncbi:hypothetical protein LZ31DRAFT_516598 [Colletotrichum somersetense]|nr:hypothetical protein LZ31DRAFT_516598 [Colletotrichum somersetense]
MEGDSEDLQVTGASHFAPASHSSGLPGFGALHTNELSVLNFHEAEGTPRDYNPDEDEVDSDDGDAVSEDGLEHHNGARAGSEEPSRNDEDDAEGADEVNERGNGVSEPDEEEEEGEDNGISAAGEDDDEFNLPQPPPIDLYRVGCRRECQRDFRQGLIFYEKQVEALYGRVQALTIKNTELVTKNAELVAKVDEATSQIEKLKNSTTKKITERTWHRELHKFITDPHSSDNISYRAIYKLCCKEENMSTNPRNVHPNLRLRQPNNNELQADALDGLSTRNIRDGSDADLEEENQVPTGEERDGPEALFVQDDEQTGVEQPPERSSLSNLPFERFPASIQANIFKWIYIQEDKLIHCISRLDPYMPPEEPTETNVNRSGLPHRFHLSGKPCNVTYAINPNEHLALLSICKKWHYLGVHAFYGLNTFAFSSLGEFGRFCTGIGAARRERIQHVELLWMGNQYLTQKPVKEDERLQWVSKRAWDASWLCQMRRLKTLVIHVNETGSDYQRRRHEPSAHIEWMTSITAGQPNFRLTRSLRTLQGLDFIHQLRGMELIQFYDFGMALKDGKRHPIRDWSFYMDIENVTAMPKTGGRAHEAEFENLTPVLRDSVPADGYLEAIKDLYRQSEAFDTKYISPANDEKTEDRHADSEMPDIVTPAARHNTTDSRAVTGVEKEEEEDEDGDVETVEQEHGDVEMLDIMTPAERRIATASRVVTGAQYSNGCRKTAATASEMGYDSTEDDPGSEDNDATPKAKVPSARLRSASSNAYASKEDGVGSDYGDEVSVAGSSEENPIDLDDFVSERTPRSTCEPSVLGSIGPHSPRESERSFGSGNGLFVSSSTVPWPRAQRESTEMTETLRNRGFEVSAIRETIDLTGVEDEPSSMSTGYPRSSQTSSTQQTLPLSAAFGPTGQPSQQKLTHRRDDNENEEFHFGKKPRRQ